MIPVLLGISLMSLMGCAQKDWIDRTLVTENVTGAWVGSFGDSNMWREVSMDLQQEGAKVTGSLTLRGPSASPVDSKFALQGSVAGDAFTFTSVRGVSGSVTVSGDDMRGQVFFAGARLIWLHRVVAPTRTDSPPR